MLTRRSLFGFALLLPFFAAAPHLVAQQPAGGTMPPPTPDQSHTPHDAALNPALPTVFIVGDSTARNSMDLGWGDHLAAFFNTSRINVANRAVAGRSSRTFLTEGHWAHVLEQLKPGDFVLIQFGHNDGGDLGGAKPRGSLKGIGDNTQDVPQTAGPTAGTTETVHSFGWYLRRYIADTRAHGATPILLTLTVRNIWTPDASGKPRIERDMGYDGFIRQVGAADHVTVLDPASLEADRLETMGQPAVAALFPRDHTHTSAAGAELVAGTVAAAIRDTHLPLARYLRPTM